MKLKHIWIQVIYLYLNSDWTYKGNCSGFSASPHQLGRRENGEEHALKCSLSPLDATKSNVNHWSFNLADFPLIKLFCHWLFIQADDCGAAPACLDCLMPRDTSYSVTLTLCVIRFGVTDTLTRFILTSGNAESILQSDDCCAGHLKRKKNKTHTHTPVCFRFNLNCPPNKHTLAHKHFVSEPLPVVVWLQDVASHIKIFHCGDAWCVFSSLPRLF